MKLVFDQPVRPVDPIERPDEAVMFVVDRILQAEQDIPGLSRGLERHTAVTSALLSVLVLPWWMTLWWGLRPGIASLIVRMIYGTLVRDLPSRLRSHGSKEGT